LTLAQLGGRPAGVPELPSPPLLERWLLESPWIAMVGLVLIGLASGWFAVRAGRGKLALAFGLLGPALAAGVYAISASVMTLREELGVKGAALIASAAEGKADVVEPVLATSLSLVVMGSPSNSGKAVLLRFVEQEMNGRFKLKEMSSQVMGASIEGENVARTQHRVRVVPEFTGFPNTSWWVLQWRRSAAGEWAVIQIEAQHIDGMRPSDRAPF